MASSPTVRVIAARGLIAAEPQPNFNLLKTNELQGASRKIFAGKQGMKLQQCKEHKEL